MVSVVLGARECADRFIGMLERLRFLRGQKRSYLYNLTTQLGASLSGGVGETPVNCAVQVPSLHCPQLHKFKHYRPTSRASI